MAPVTLTLSAAASLVAVRRLLLPSRTVIVTVVTDPAVPAGTDAVVWAALAAPGLTTLAYVLPLIPVPFSVIARLSVPLAVGV